MQIATARWPSLLHRPVDDSCRSLGGPRFHLARSKACSGLVAFNHFAWLELSRCRFRGADHCLASIGHVQMSDVLGSHLPAGTGLQAGRGSSNDGDSGRGLDDVGSGDLFRTPPTIRVWAWSAASRIASQFVPRTHLANR